MASMAAAEPGCGAYKNAAALNAEYQSYEDLLGLWASEKPGPATKAGCSAN